MIQKKRSGGPIHQALISHLESEGWTTACQHPTRLPRRSPREKLRYKRFNFQTNVARALRRSYRCDEWVVKYTQSWLYRSWRIRPDAYRIDRANRTIDVVEVECEHPVKDSRLDAYRQLYWLLEYIEWDFRLFLMDGRDASMRHIDFLSVELMLLSERRRENIS